MAIIPFSNVTIGKLCDIQGCSYSAMVQLEFFPRHGSGVAATIWAEFFGYLGIPVLIIVLDLMFRVTEAGMRRLRSSVLVAGLAVAIVNVSFYVSRKELLGAFVSAKTVFKVAFIVLVFVSVVRH